jgi:hypothetical protein
MPPTRRRRPALPRVGLRCALLRCEGRRRPAGSSPAFRRARRRVHRLQKLLPSLGRALRLPPLPLPPPRRPPSTLRRPLPRPLPLPIPRPRHPAPSRLSPLSSLPPGSRASGLPSPHRPLSRRRTPRRKRCRADWRCRRPDRPPWARRPRRDSPASGRTPHKKRRRPTPLRRTSCTTRPSQSPFSF